MPASSVINGTALKIAAPSILPSTGTSELNAVAPIAPSATIARLNENSGTAPIKAPRIKSLEQELGAADRKKLARRLPERCIDRQVEQH
jgi:hypothetical protein